jgi:xanthine dehydrogenase YagR molybdenum-binding subunit
MAPKEPMRRDRFPSGIAGVSVDEIERQVPASEAPPLPPNDRLMVIGKRVLRINARAKVTGAARFTVDIKLAGMLHGRLLRSPHAHARIISIDSHAAERHPDVRAVHIITDNPVSRLALGCRLQARRAADTGAPFCASYRLFL